MAILVVSRPCGVAKPLAMGYLRNPDFPKHPANIPQSPG